MLVNNEKSLTAHSYLSTNFILSAGLASFEGAFDNAEITVGGSTVTFYTSITIPSLTLSSGTISSPDGIVVRVNNMLWSGGTVACSRLEVSSDSDDAILEMLSGSLVIGGFFTVSAQLFQCGSSVSVVVQSGSVFQTSSFAGITCAFSGPGTFATAGGALQYTAKILPDHLVVFGSLTLTQIIQVKTLSCYGSNIFLSTGTLVVLDQSYINATNLHLTTNIENKGKLILQDGFFVGGSTSTIVNDVNATLVIADTSFDPGVLISMHINNSGMLEINSTTAVVMPSLSNSGTILLSTSASIQYTNNCGGNIVLKNQTTLQLIGPAIVSSAISGNGTLNFTTAGIQLLKANVNVPTVYLLAFFILIY